MLSSSMLIQTLKAENGTEILLWEIYCTFSNQVWYWNEIFILQGGRRVRSKLYKKDQAFIQLTLARCKEFENIGMSCFRQPNLLGVLFSAPSAGKKAKAVQGKNLTIGSSRKRHRKEDAAGIFYTLSSHQIEAPIFLLCHNMSISTVHFIYETEICPLVWSHIPVFAETNFYSQRPWIMS